MEREPQGDSGGSIIRQTNPLPRAMCQSLPWRVVKDMLKELTGDSQRESFSCDPHQGVMGEQDFISKIKVNRPQFWLPAVYSDLYSCLSLVHGEGSLDDNSWGQQHDQ